MTFQTIPDPTMPKQEDIIALTDPDTGDTMYVSAAQHIEHKTVFGAIPDLSLIHI